MENKMSIIEYLMKKRCRNILMYSDNGKKHEMSINFDLTKEEYDDISKHFDNKDYLLNEYKEPIKLTHDEYIILKNIDKNYQWIVREKDNRLFLYKDKPYKGNKTWYGENWTSLALFNHLFKFIMWEDEEPYNIKELLENCEVFER